MRTVRLALLAAFVVVSLGTAAPAAASKCTQYPYFIQPLICRLLEG